LCYSRARINGTWETVKAISGGSSKLPDIAVGNDVVFATWTGRNQNGVYDIYYTYRSKAFNSSWSTPQLVNPLPAGIEKQQAPAVEIDGNDVAHIIWTPVFLNSGGVRQVRHAYWTGNGFSAPQNISGQYLLHYPAIHERGNNIYCVWQMGGYEAGSSIDYNNRIFGNWQGQQSVPSSSGSTYSDVATSPYQDEVYYLWDANGDIWIHIKQVFTMGLLPVIDGSDYNNDGYSDLTVWRPTNGFWYLKDIGQYGFGQLGDIPAPGDYNGDGATDSAVWRPTNGYWYIRNIGNFQYGKSGDIPVPGDYNGDNVTDLAVYRSSNGTWYINNVGAFQWGTLGDFPVPGDYDGDNVTELAVWRPTNGVWYIKDVGNYQWGSANDVPIPADYNGDGSTDVAVWRPANGVWYLRNIGVHQWGADGDIPVPGKYDGAAGSDIAVWRPANGVWYIRNIATHFWGLAGDYPLVR
jgi:hypothetical protein